MVRMALTSLLPCITPMLATPGSLPTDVGAYAYEVKWDGYRIIAQRHGRSLKLCSRSGLDLLPRFPELKPLAAAIPAGGALDGELVALDNEGRSGFSALQTCMPGLGVRNSERRWNPDRWRIVFMAFDYLLDGRTSFMTHPWEERRAALDALGLDGPTWSCPPVHPDGTRLLRAIGEAGGEGIMAKRRTSIYRPGVRSRDWIKVKLTRREEFVIGGYWLGGAHRVLGSLLLGAFTTLSGPRHRQLRYVGKVGTGFGEQERGRLRSALDELRCKVSPFDGPVPDSGVVWCQPLLVAEIGYAEWTHEGHLRHARYQGIRTDKRADEVFLPAAGEVAT